MFRFEVEGDPVSTNAMYARGAARPHLTQEARDWKERVAWSWITSQLSPTGRFSGPPYGAEVDLELTIHYHHRYPRRRLDNDNLVKLVQDGMQGVAFHNDKQIARLVVERSHDPERPRLVITLQHCHSQ